MVRFVAEEIDNGWLLTYEGDALGLTRVFFAKDFDGLVTAARHWSGNDEDESADGETL